MYSHHGAAICQLNIARFFLTRQDFYDSLAGPEHSSVQGEVGTIRGASAIPFLAADGATDQLDFQVSSTSVSVLRLRCDSIARSLYESRLSPDSESRLHLGSCSMFSDILRISVR